jgi:hypothetical protein
MFLDAIRYSVEMAELSYLRLADTLHTIALSKEERSDDVPSSVYLVSAMQDAWSIVDSIFRLRTLLEHMPHFKQKSPGFQLFFRQTKDVERLRHVVQHLNSEIPKLIKLNISAWGALSWSTVMDAENLKIRTCTIIPGTMFAGYDYNAVNPLGRAFYGVVDHITLQASSYQLSLSDVMRSVAKLTERITQMIKPQIEGHPSGVSDITFMADIEGNKPEPSSTKASDE